MENFACSVVIPTYNGASTLPEQLAALGRQDIDQPFEVLVSDNGSTDASAAVARSWSDRLELRVVDASRGRGVSVARNVGIEAAASDRILVCDADDRVSDGWVRAMSKALDHFPFVGGPLVTTTLSGPSAAWVPIPERTEGLPLTWQERPYCYGCNLGMRRGVFDAVGGFDETYGAGAEEIDFAWRARDAGYPAHYAPDALIHYRIRDDLRGVLRQQYNSGLGIAQLYVTFRPPEVRTRVAPSGAARGGVAADLPLARRPRRPWRVAVDGRLRGRHGPRRPPPPLPRPVTAPAVRIVGPLPGRPRLPRRGPLEEPGPAPAGSSDPSSTRWANSALAARTSSNVPCRDHASVAHEDQLVAVADRRQPVRHDDMVTEPLEALDGLGEPPLGLVVEGRGGLVEQELRGVAVQRAGDADALSLAAGEPDTAFADHGVRPPGSEATRSVSWARLRASARRASSGSSSKAMLSRRDWRRAGTRPGAPRPAAPATPAGSSGSRHRRR